MREKLTRNLGLKILSLFMAIFIWLIILNIANPVIQKSYYHIQVTKINENVIAQKDKVYEVVSGDTVDVTIKAKRSVIEALKTTDIKAVADLSELSLVNAVQINVSVPGHERDIMEITQDTSTMKVSLENQKTEQFRINVVTQGEVASGYYIKDKTTSPNIIQVSGAETVINRIKEVDVEVAVTNQRQSFVTSAVPKVYDKNGSLMDSDKLTFNYDTVDVTVNLLQTKTVNLFIEVTGTPYSGYKYVDFEYEPKQVVIAGEKDELDKVQYIMGEYNIDNQKEDIEDQVNIADFIKNDVILIDDNQTAVINVKIEKLDTKDLSYDASDIEFRNVPKGAMATLNSNIFNVVLYGSTEVLNSVNKYNLRPYIDLKKAKVGTNTMSIEFNSPNGVTLVNPSVVVTLKHTGG
ncbi:CdaR family protein [Anaerocolumna chitinilytica]|uniref:YbbR-like protein n=1 Tax=Anaerocolumna chitinilytica TaxID=1727145 RepID=A0A7I8DGZ0_9FIRM|nr:CdaR family protein [Anaerocolumna chitinilytica]BCJ97622.1 hypothetical protein bsdcttw_06630 [Anaerocolumna chitinilytica]